MKKFLLFLSIILWCGCSNELPFDTDSADVSVKTRAANDSTYYFQINTNTNKIILNMGNTSAGISVMSYKDDNGVVTDLKPEVVHKPDWVDSVEVRHVYYRYYAVVVEMQSVPTLERTGVIEIKQPESNKRMSFEIVQYGSINNVSVSLTEPFPNHPVFTATTTYPVEKDITCCVPYEVYNDGGIYDGNATIKIPQGETKGIYEMDYNGSQLVYEHGNVKYRLHEGTIFGDDVYTYSFIRYW